MPQINNIHDKFIKQLLSDKEIAIAFLRDFLPTEVTDFLDLGSLTYENTSYLSTELKESYSDMVWRINSKTDKQAKVCLLLEHKSYVDTYVGFQLLEYMALGYQKQLKEKKQLELIIPVVYYHGQEKWAYQPLPSFFEKYPDFLKAYLPAFKTEFINLQTLEQEQLQALGNGLIRSVLTIQRYYDNETELNNSITRILDSLNPYLESNLVYVIFVYLLHSSKLDKEKLRIQLSNFPDTLNKKVMSIYDELIQEGIEKGIEKGVEKGIEKAILNSFDNGFSIEQIRLITGETTVKIKEILKKNGRG